MATTWYYRDGDDAEVGPHTPRQFAALVRRGVITPVTEVRREGGGGTLRGMFGG